MMIGGIVALLIAELALRTLGVTSKLVYSPDPHYGWRHNAGDEFFWTTESRELEIRINALGLRDNEHSYEKPENTSRILVLGDSFPEALQVRLEDAFSEVLETTLNKQVGRRAEVINAGVSGFGTDNALLFFSHEGYKYSPDIVVLTFYVGNDVRNNWAPLEEQDSGGPRKPYYDIGPEGLRLNRYPFDRDDGWIGPVKLFLARHSRVYGFVRESWNRFGTRMIEAGRNDKAQAAETRIPLDLPLFQSDPPREWDEAWQLTGAILRELKAEVARHGGQLLVVTVPAAFQVHSEIWEERLASNGSLRHIEWSLEKPNANLSQICKEEGIANLDLLPMMRAEAGISDSLLYFFHDNHWNEAGHHFAATRVAEILAPMIQDSESD